MSFYDNNSFGRELKSHYFDHILTVYIFQGQGTYLIRRERLVIILIWMEKSENNILFFNLVRF